MAETKKNPLVSLLGGIILTLILVVVVPVVTSWLIEPIVTDLIDTASGDSDTVIGLSSGLIGAIVMLIVMVIFMILLGGGAILKKYGIIGVVGLILAYEFLLQQKWGWVIPVAILIVLAVVSYLRDKKK